MRVFFHAGSLLVHCWCIENAAQGAQINVNGRYTDTPPFTDEINTSVKNASKKSLPREAYWVEPAPRSVLGIALLR